MATRRKVIEFVEGMWIADVEKKRLAEIYRTRVFADGELDRDLDALRSQVTSDTLKLSALASEMVDRSLKGDARWYHLQKCAYTLQRAMHDVHVRRVPMSVCREAVKRA